MTGRLAAAVVLAGGRSQRMGTEKAFVELNGRPLLAHVIDRLAAQTDAIAINANGDAARFAGFDCEVIPDSITGHPGPLAGVLAAMEWGTRRGFARVVTAAVDTPLLPNDLVARLLADAPDGPTFARTAEGPQPVVASWPVALRSKLADDLRAGRAAKVIDWAFAHGAAAVDFGDGDAFFNINTPDDLAQAKALLASRRAHRL